MVDVEWLDDQLLADLRPTELRNLRDERGPKLDGSAARCVLRPDDAHIPRADAVGQEHASAAR